MLDRQSLGPNELLLALARRDSEASLPPPYLAILRDSDDRQAFLQLAARHFLHGLVLSRLATLDAIDADHDEIRTRSLATLRTLRAEASFWDLERDRLLTLLALRDIHPVLLKGAALRCTVYRDSVHRPLGDIDLLVRPGQFDLALPVLSDVGYRAPYSSEAIRDIKKYHFHLRLIRERFIVEVHWGLGQESQPFDLDAAAFIRNAHRVEYRTGDGGPASEALIPAAEDMLLHLVSQNLHHGTRLGRLVDIDRLAAENEDLDWETLRSRAIEAGLEVALAVDLRLCQALLGSPAPQGFVGELGLSRARLRNLAILRPESWAFSTTSTRPTVRDLRRRWCVSDDFKRSKRRGERPLQWIWPDQHTEIERTSPFTKVKRASKLIAYQAWLYLRAAASCLGSEGRRELMFWQGPSNDALS